MGPRDRLKRLERATEGFHGTLVLPDGSEVRYTGEEMLDAILAAVDEEEHPLLPYLRQMDTAEALPGLVRALEGGRDHGA
jgi:hypothetical protein